MDLMSLNNQIVALRNPIKVAKVFAIRQLTRKIASLRKKKGTEQQQQKNQRKADRLHSKIAQIQKLELTELAICALRDLKVQDSNKIATGTDDDVGIMLKCKQLVTAVKAFRMKYPNWQSELPILLGMRDVRRRFSHNSPAKKQKLQQQKPKLTETSGEESDKEIVTEQPKATKKTKLKMQSRKTKKQKKKHVNIEEKLPVLVHQEVMLGDAKSEDGFKEKVEGEMEIKKLSLEAMEQDNNELASLQEEVVKSESERLPPVVKSATSRPKDSFFMTGDNESGEDASEMASDNDAERYSSDSEISKMPPIARHQRLPGYATKASTYRQQKKDNKYQKFSKFPAKASMHKQARNSKNQSFSKVSKKPFQKPSTKEFKSPMSKRLQKLATDKQATEVLHPSWEAKRKQKTPQIAKFEGKKIVFD